MAEKKTIEIIFRKSPNYSVVAAHGVWGGIGPSGDITAQIFTDIREIPESITLDLSDLPNVRETDRKIREEYKREIQTVLIFRPEVAYQVGKWLLDRAKEAGFEPGKLPQ